jgi:hypothetical protein
MLGIGRLWGKPIDSPRCSRLSNIPASMRAALENGGDLISPFSHTTCLSVPFISSMLCHFRHNFNGETKKSEKSDR